MRRTNLPTTARDRGGREEQVVQLCWDKSKTKGPESSLNNRRCRPKGHARRRIRNEAHDQLSDAVRETRPAASWSRNRPGWPDRRAAPFPRARRPSAHPTSAASCPMATGPRSRNSVHSSVTGHLVSTNGSARKIFTRKNRPRVCHGSKMLATIREVFRDDGPVPTAGFEIARLFGAVFGWTCHEGGRKGRRACVRQRGRPCGRATIQAPRDGGPVLALRRSE